MLRVKVHSLETTKNENEFLASFTNKDGIWFPWTSECVSSSKVATTQAYSKLFRVNPLGTITDQTPKHVGSMTDSQLLPTPITTIYPKDRVTIVSYLLNSSNTTVRLESFSPSIPSSFLNDFPPVAEQWGLKVCFTADPLHKHSSIRPKTEIMKHREVKVVAEGGLEQSSAGPLRSPAGVSLETSGGVGDGGIP